MCFERELLDHYRLVFERRYGPVEDLIDSLTRGNPTEVKVVLASVVTALAVYQLVLIAVGYGKLRPPFLGARPASLAHRASGDAIVAIRSSSP